MALLYSYLNQPPQPLPERIRLEDGTTLRPPVSNAKLGEAGWFGPIPVPSYDPDTQVLVWDTNDMEYVVQDLTAEEQQLVLRRKQEARADYRAFYNSLILSVVYQSIREQAQSSLPLTVACTEFVAAMSDAKVGAANPAVVQACINGILSAASLTDENLEELYNEMEAAGLWGLYSLGDYQPPIAEKPAAEVVVPEEPVPADAPEEPVAEEPEVSEPAAEDVLNFADGVTGSSTLNGDSLFGSEGTDTVSF